MAADRGLLLRAGTRRAIIAAHPTPACGQRAIEDLSAEEIQAWTAALPVAHRTKVKILTILHGECETSAMRARELLSGSIALVVAATLAACGQDATTDAAAGAREVRATATAETASRSEAAKQYETVDEALKAIRARVDVPVRLPSNLPGNLRLAVDPKFANGGAQLYLRDGKRNLIVEYGHAGFDGCGPTTPRRVAIGQSRGVMQVHRRGKRPYTTVVWPATPQRPVGAYGLTGSFSPSELLRLAREMNTEPSDRAARKQRGC